MKIKGHFCNKFTTRFAKGHKAATIWYFNHCNHLYQLINDFYLLITQVQEFSIHLAKSHKSYKGFSKVIELLHYTILHLNIFGYFQVIPPCKKKKHVLVAYRVVLWRNNMMDMVQSCSNCRKSCNAKP